MIIKYFHLKKTDKKKLKVLLNNVNVTISKEKNKLIKSFSRQALHASKLCFNHPINNKYLEFSSPLPKDISVLIEELKV